MREALLRIQRPLLCALSFIPLALLFCCEKLPDTPLLWALTPLLHVVLSCACLLPHGKARLWIGLGCAAVLMVVSCVLLPIAEDPSLLVLPIAYAVLLLVLLPIGGWPKDQELSPAFPALGCVNYLIAHVLLTRAPRVWGILTVPLFLCFQLFLLLALLAMNRNNLSWAMVDRTQRPPEMLRRRNRVFILALWGGATLLSLVPALGKVLNGAWQAIKTAVAAFLGLFQHESEEIMPLAGGPADDIGFGAMEASEPSFWAVLFEKIFMALATVLCIGVIVLLIVLLAKRVARLLARIAAQLHDFAVSATEDYVDEAVDTRLDEQAQPLGQRLRASLHRTRPATPRDRIRYAYAKARRRHAAWPDSSTARENLPQGAAQLYETARYSQHDVTDADAEAFSRRLKELRSDG